MSTVLSASKIHLLELMPVTLFLVVLTHLIFSRICIGFQLINALNSNLPHWRTTFSTPLSLLIYVLCSIVTLSHVLCILPTPIFCRFHVSAQPLPPAVLALQPPQSGTHYPLASVVLPLQTLSVASLKLSASSRPTAPPSSSVKCLRFGHWLTLCTLNIVFAYLLTHSIIWFKSHQRGCRWTWATMTWQHPWRNTQQRSWLVLMGRLCKICQIYIPCRHRHRPSSLSLLADRTPERQQLNHCHIELDLVLVMMRQDTTHLMPVLVRWRRLTARPHMSLRWHRQSLLASRSASFQLPRIACW